VNVFAADRDPRAALLLALILSMISALTACSKPAATTGELRIDLPDATSNITNGWFLNISVDGGTARRVQVDTGSVGLAIGASAIPLSAKKLSSGSITYSSSGKTLSGDVYLVTIGYTALTNVQTIEMPVLGVKTVTCNLVTNPTCVVAPGEADSVGVLGVGFGRHGSGADLADVVNESEAAVNPFLQLSGMTAGSVRQAYAIYPDHIILGITPDDVAQWQSFALTQANGDWNPLAGCVTAGSYAPSCTGGTVLVDTGVGSTILSVPDEASGTVAAGTAITISIGTSAPLSFAFTSTGATCSGIVLSCARWSHRTSLPIAVNTSRRLIEAANYRFDNVSGTVSLQKN
jgi:hypothetical protein